MSPRSVSHPLLRESPVLDADTTIAAAARAVVASGLPALPVVEHDRLVGIFGEREFMGAIFPGYLKELHYAAFVSRSLEASLQKRSSCRNEAVRVYMNTDHIDVGPEFSDAEVAEIFLHHRVLLVPVTDEGHVVGVITRSDFFRALVQRFLDA